MCAKCICKRWKKTLRWCQRFVLFFFAVQATYVFIYKWLAESRNWKITNDCEIRINCSACFVCVLWYCLLLVVVFLLLVRSTHKPSNVLYINSLCLCCFCLTFPVWQTHKRCVLMCLHIDVNITLKPAFLCIAIISNAISISKLIWNLNMVKMIEIDGSVMEGVNYYQIKFIVHLLIWYCYDSRAVKFYGLPSLWVHWLGNQLKSPKFERDGRKADWTHNISMVIIFHEWAMSILP